MLRCYGDESGVAGRLQKVREVICARPHFPKLVGADICKSSTNLQEVIYQNLMPISCSSSLFATIAMVDKKLSLQGTLRGDENQVTTVLVLISCCVQCSSPIQIVACQGQIALCSSGTTAACGRPGRTAPCTPSETTSATASCAFKGPTVFEQT
jgi:hypothetical protein